MVEYPKLPRQTAHPAFSASLYRTEPSQDPIRPSFDLDTPATFFIPRSLQDSGPKHYAYELYETSSRQRVRLTYCQTLDESEQCASRFLNEPVIGFDMEWMVDHKPGIKNNVSLIQVASEKEIALFHIALHSGTSPEDLMAPSLRLLIESPHITKTGVAVWSADGKRLARFFDIEPRGFFELSHLHNLVTHGATNPHLVNKRLVSLATLNLQHLKLPLFKDRNVRCTDWMKPNLTQDEIRYAATDAYAGYQLFRVLNRKRLEMSPCPPLPAFAELGMPITLPIRPDMSEVFVDESGNTQAIDRQGVKVLEALKIWKIQAVRDSGYLDRILVDDEVLFQIAVSRPRTMDQLLEIDGPHTIDLGLGAQWLRIVRQCRETSESSISSQSTSSSFSTICESAESVVADWATDDEFGDDEDSEGQTDTSLSLTQSPKEEQYTLGVIPDEHDSSGSSQSTVKPEVAHQFDRSLFSALCGLRVQLAKKTQTDVASIASDEALRTLATLVPSTTLALEQIQGIGTMVAVANLYRKDLLINWVTRYKGREDSSVDFISSQLSQTTISSNV